MNLPNALSPAPSLPPQATSRHLKHITELTLIAPLKQGFVGVADVMSYSTRLHIVLKTLFELRRVSIERDQLESAGALERLRSLYDVRWAIVENETKLLLAVTFDRSWESYIQGIVDFAGDLLDLIFSHCADYAGHECSNGYAAFATWVRRHQVQCDFFYASSPDLTVDDQRFLTQLARSGTGSHDAAAAVMVGDPAEQATESSGNRALVALYDLKKWFDTKDENGQEIERDRRLWDNAARVTIPRLERLDPSNFADEDVRNWLVRLQTKPSETPNPRAPINVEAVRANVQANILRRCEGMTSGAVALLRCEDAAGMHALLKRVCAHIKSDATQGRDEPLLNIGFTYAGLRHLPISSKQLLELPKEFREGMEARAGLLGDTGPINSPEHWSLPPRNGSGDNSGAAVSLAAADVVLILQAKIDAAGDCAVHKWSKSHPLYARLSGLVPSDGVEVLHVQALWRNPDAGKREHFGFIDQTSQPAPDLPGLNANAAQRDRVPLGEILLGYENARGKTESWSPGDGTSLNLFQDGSFLVLRKLEQDVRAFEQFAAENATSLNVPAHQVKSAILGRDYSTGSALVGMSDSNDFDYAGDPNGKRCPLHAHIRRVNPRPLDAAARQTTPRILRRGFAYGPSYSEKTASEERGLFFMAYNASIAQQFEVIQRWINGGNSSGTFSGQVDLFSGALPPNPAPQYIHVRGSAQPLRSPPNPLVKLRWGMYLFVPSLKTLQRWSDDVKSAGTRPTNDALQLAWGRRMLEGLPLENEVQRRAPAHPVAGEASSGLVAWKQLIEDVGAAEQRAALWAAIRHKGGVLRTAYGVLVGGAKLVEEVLNDDGSTFSVGDDAYGSRMEQSAGLQYLGIDYCTNDYDAAATLPNAFAYEMDEPSAFKEAHALTSAFLLKQAPPIGHAMESTRRRQVHIEQLAAIVLSSLVRKWFGLPGEPKATIKRLLITSKYVFQPQPGKHLEAMAKTAGAELRESYLALAAGGPQDARGTFLERLDSEKMSAAARATAVQSLASGFFAATFGTFLAAMDPWIESGALWRLPTTNDPERVRLKAALHQALLRRQGPTVIYRRCRHATRLGGLELEEGDLVVLGIGSAANEQPSTGFKWLFGGDYDVEKDASSKHACPAQKMAIGVMLGMTAAILQQTNLSRVRRFVLEYDVAVTGRESPVQVQPSPSRVNGTSVDERPSTPPSG